MNSNYRALGDVMPDIGHVSKWTHAIFHLVGTRYETGDHVSILPSNDPVLVAGTLSWTGARPDQWFTVTGNTR